MRIRGITVCVGYDDLLSIVLPRNARHLAEVLVVTHPDDHATKAVAAGVPNARVLETDAFYRDGAKFAKGLAMEEGFDALGREGWLLVFDADTLFPETMPLPELRPENLYTPYRRLLNDPRDWYDGISWKRLRLRRDVEFAGYFQLFHADCDVLQERPWYGTNYTHCGGCDAVFQDRWPEHRKIRPPFNVLHLGPCDQNWFGRATERLDGADVPQADQHRADMERFLSYKGWGRRRTVPHFNEFIQPPGEHR